MNLKQKYSNEIDNIKSLTEELRQGKIYEITRVRGDSSAYKLANDIDNKLNDLIIKINNNEDGNWESFNKNPEMSI